MFSRRLYTCPQCHVSSSELRVDTPSSAGRLCSRWPRLRPLREVSTTVVADPSDSLDSVDFDALHVYVSVTSRHRIIFRATWRSSGHARCLRASLNAMASPEGSARPVRTTLGTSRHSKLYCFPYHHHPLLSPCPHFSCLTTTHNDIIHVRPARFCLRSTENSGQ